MSTSSTSSVRIHASPPDQESPHGVQEPGSRDKTLARLYEQARAKAQAWSEPATPDGDPGVESHEPRQHEEDMPDDGDPEDDAQESALPQEASVLHASTPQQTPAGMPDRRGNAVAAANARTRPMPSDSLVDFIVRRVADFCSTPTVLSSGTWRISIPLDPSLVPGCTLLLTLSHFDLTLRFDTSDDSTRALLLQRSKALRASLVEVLDSRQASRSVEIIVR
jgi:hypothetical protein